MDTHPTKTHLTGTFVFSALTTTWTSNHATDYRMDQTPAHPLSVPYWTSGKTTKHAGHLSKVLEMSCWVLGLKPYFNVFLLWEGKTVKEGGRDRHTHRREVWFGWSHDQWWQCLLSDSQLVSMTTPTKRSFCKQKFYANRRKYFWSILLINLFKKFVLWFCLHQHNYVMNNVNNNFRCIVASEN